MVSRSAASGGPQNKAQRAVTRSTKTRLSISPLTAAAIVALLVTRWHQHCLPIMFTLLVVHSNITGRAASWQRVPKNRTR